AAADRQQSDAVLDRGGDGIALAAQHVLGDESLVAVLAAADVDQVVLGGVEPVSGAGGRVAEAHAAPLAATLEGDHVAPVRVDGHLLGVERQQAQLGPAHTGTSSSTTTESASFGPELIWRRPAGRKPASDASLSSPSGLIRKRTSSCTSRSIR